MKGTSFQGKKKIAGSSGAFYLTGMKNTDVIEDSVHEEEPKAKTAKPMTQSEIFKNIIEHAEKGGEDLLPNAQVKEPVQPQLTTAEFANVTNLLATIAKNHESSHIQPDQERGRHEDSGFSVARVGGIMYPVSDTFDHCSYCTRSRKCERHRKTEYFKTSVSLCKNSHLRMSVSWDITDPENRKGSWKFAIDERFEDFMNAKQERETHEKSLASKSSAAQDKATGKISSMEKDLGCQPMEPKSRIKELAKRMMEDYNEEQKNVARKANLDLKGREYKTSSSVWGGKDPFTPSTRSHTRAAHETGYRLDGGRIDRELRALLAAWYYTQRGAEEKFVDRTFIIASKYWSEKVLKLKLAKTAKKQEDESEAINKDKADPLSKRLLQDLKQTPRKAQAEPQNRYKMTTWDRKKLEVTSFEPIDTAPKKTEAPLTAEEKKLIKKMAKAAEAEAKETSQAEAEALEQQQDSKVNIFDAEERNILPETVKMEIETVEQTTVASSEAVVAQKTTGTKRKRDSFDLPEPVEKRVKTEIASSSKPQKKRKAPTADGGLDGKPTKKRRMGKSAEFIEDSDDAADY